MTAALRCAAVGTEAHERHSAHRDLRKERHQRIRGVVGVATTGDRGAAIRLEGRLTAGGKKSRNAVTKLLGISESGLPYRVGAVAWVDRELQVSVTLTDGKEVVFTFTRRTEDSEGIILTPHLAVSYSGAEIPRALGRLLETVGASRLEEWDMRRLAGLIANDPESGKPGQPMPTGDDLSSRPRSLLDTWGESDAYADFFAGGEISRAQLDSLDPTNFFVFLQHGDQECAHVNPHGIAPVMGLVSYPWDERLRRDRSARSDGFVDFATLDQMLSSDLTENDVIMGNPEKLRAVLNKGVEVAKRLDKTLFFSNTCVPVVTGEDVESEIKRARGSCDCPVLYLTVTPRAMVNVFHDVLVTRRLEAEALRTPRGPNVVNLVGYARNRAHGEILALLEAVNVEHNVSLLPDLNFDLIEVLPEATLNVFLPNSLWQHLYDQLTFESSVPGISPLPPYGLAGSRDWLTAVTAALNVPAISDVAWDDLVAPLRPRWDALAEEAQGYRLGLVVRASETHYLTKPTSSWGVPLVATLEEMGFSLDVLLKLDSREEAAKAAKEIYGTFSAPNRHSIKGFNSPDMLRTRLAELPCQAILTYHSFDWRVTQAGKNVFSLQHFEPGLLGALRTLERLIGICRTPYFGRYGRYLPRTREGLRISPEER